jgi:hypothetical protein
MKYAKFIIMFLAFILFNVICFSASEHDSANESPFSKEILPLTFWKGVPIVKVNINGKPIFLVVDTGADAVTIALKPSSLQDLKVKYLGNQMNSMDIQGNLYKERYFEIPEFHMGGLKFENFIACEEQRSSVPMDGIIGNQFLRNFYVLFDYKKAQFVLYPKNGYPAELNSTFWKYIPFEHNNIGMILTAKIDALDKNFKFCLDSGFSFFNHGRPCGALRSRYIRALPKGIHSLEYDHIRIGAIDLGPTEFLIDDSPEPPVDGFLGNNFFRQFKVFIDFDQAVLLLKKY